MQDNVHEPHGLPKVHHDEQHAHRDRRYGQELAEYDDSTERLVVVQVVRYYKHHRRCRHADQERKLGYVYAPGDVPAHARKRQACLELSEVCKKSKPDNHGKEDHPCLVPGASSESFFKHSYTPPIM